MIEFLIFLAGALAFLLLLFGATGTFITFALCCVEPGDETIKQGFLFSCTILAVAFLLILIVIP